MLKIRKLPCQMGGTIFCQNDNKTLQLHQFWKLYISIFSNKKNLLQKGFQPIVSAEQWEWQLGHKFDACILVLLHSFLRVNPNWHEGWYFYLLVLFGSDFVSRIFIKNFQTFWVWKLTSIELIWHLTELIKVAPKMSIFLAFIAHANEG